MKRQYALQLWRGDSDIQLSMQYYSQQHLICKILCTVLFHTIAGSGLPDKLSGPPGVRLQPPHSSEWLAGAPGKPP